MVKANATPPQSGWIERDTVGAAEVVRQLEELNQQHAPRYTPAAVLTEMARAGRRFYPAEGKPV